MSKYGNKKVELDGFLFDSLKESRRYSELKLLEYNGEIENLELQPQYPCFVNKKKITTYIADFRYKENGKVVIEDVKSEATRKIAVYRLKKKLTEALYGIIIFEV